MKSSQFQKIVWDFYRENRRNFPWRKTRNPYKILVSEIMLQQTQTHRVLPKYELFIKKFPDFQVLAEAPTSEVLKLWHGLGYNRRALALQRLAETVVKKFNGKLPQDQMQLEELPGIGPYTAGALLVFAFNTPAHVIETNIRRVYLHHFFKDSKSVHDKKLMPLIESTLPSPTQIKQKKFELRDWYYGLMDYGGHLGGLLRTHNPNRKSAHYARQTKFEGSHRQLRGQILNLLMQRGQRTKKNLATALEKPGRLLQKTLTELMREGFLTAEKEKYSLRN